MINEFFDGGLKMKKLMILMLVLGMATAANAALSLSVTASDPINGNYTFDILGGPYNAFQGDTWAVLTDQGSITGGTPVVITNLINTIDPGTAESNPSVLNPTGTTGLWGNTLWTDFVGSMPGGTTVYTSFSVTGVANLGTVWLYSGLVADQTIGSVQGSFAVVPEPMTMALLGLGGLFIRRKK